MKEKSILFIFVLVCSFTGFTFDTGSEPGQWRKTLDLDFENTALDCWSVGGEYKIEPDNTDVYHGRQSPKGTTNWKQYSVELDVPLVTTTLYFGAVIYGEGSAWVDDLSIDVLPALGSNPLAIGGTVLDKNKTPVPNALIAAKTLYHETAMACASSDKNGEFEFHFPAGTYMLTVTEINYLERIRISSNTNRECIA